MRAPNWFLALPLPPEAGWHRVAATAPAGLRRFAPEDLHLTLAFLGPCGEPAALEAWRSLEPVSCPAMRIGAGGWRALGPPRQPSAYGLTLARGHDDLVELLASWEPCALAAAGLAPPQRPPLPHITLLRPRRQEALQWRQPMAEWMEAAPLPPGEALLQELALWTWDPERSARLFLPVRRRSLA